MPAPNPDSVRDGMRLTKADRKLRAEVMQDLICRRNWSLEEVGRHYGVSRQRVHQIITDLEAEQEQTRSS